MTTEFLTSVLGLLQFVSVATALVWGFNSQKKSNEQLHKDRTQEAVARATAEQKTQDALEQISSTVKEILKSLTDYEKTLNDHHDQIMILQNGQKHMADDIVDIESRVSTLEKRG